MHRYLLYIRHTLKEKLGTHTHTHTCMYRQIQRSVEGICGLSLMDLTREIVRRKGEFATLYEQTHTHSHTLAHCCHRVPEKRPEQVGESNETYKMKKKSTNGLRGASQQRGKHADKIERRQGDDVAASRLPESCRRFLSGSTERGRRTQTDRHTFIRQHETKESSFPVCFHGHGQTGILLFFIFTCRCYVSSPNLPLKLSPPAQTSSPDRSPELQLDSLSLRSWWERVGYFQQTRLKTNRRAEEQILLGTERNTFGRL